MTELGSQEFMWNATLYFGFELTWNCIFIKCGVDHALCVHPLNLFFFSFLYLIKATLELFFFAFFVCMLSINIKLLNHDMVKNINNLKSNQSAELKLKCCTNPKKGSVATLIALHSLFAVHYFSTCTCCSSSHNLIRLTHEMTHQWLRWLLLVWVYKLLILYQLVKQFFVCRAVYCYFLSVHIVHFFN